MQLTWQLVDSMCALALASKNIWLYPCVFYLQQRNRINCYFDITQTCNKMRWTRASFTAKIILNRIAFESIQVYTDVEALSMPLTMSLSWLNFVAKFIEFLFAFIFFLYVKFALMKQDSVQYSSAARTMFNIITNDNNNAECG